MGGHLAPPDTQKGRPPRHGTPNLQLSNSRHPGCSSLDKTGDPLTSKEGLDSPGGPVAKNALANAGDLGWTPGPRRFHVQLRLGVTTLSAHPAILKPSCPEPVLLHKKLNI